MTTTKTRTEALRYYGKCRECGEPATYGQVDGVALCTECAATYGLTTE